MNENDDDELKSCEMRCKYFLRSYSLCLIMKDICQTEALLSQMFEKKKTEARFYSN